MKCQNGQTECPATVSTATNRTKLSAIWDSPEWAEFVRVHTAGKACEQCGRHEGDIAINKDGEEYIVHLTVDHPFRWAYKSKELYLDFEASMCRVVCRTCNGLFEKGLDICPVCKKAYKPMREPMCRECYFEKYPQARVAYEQGQIDQKNRQQLRRQKKRHQANPHPCARHGQLQRCLREPGAICGHNRVNAPKKCGYFKVRKVPA